MEKYYDLLINYGIRLVVKKRYTILEIKRKLRNRAEKLSQEQEMEEFQSYDNQNIDFEETIERVIARLMELNYINDEKFAEDYLSDKQKFKPKSSFLLTRDLKKKGIGIETIDKALHEVKYSNFDAAMELLAKKMHKWENFDLWEQKTKAYRYLVSKGFGSDDIYKVLNCCYSQGE